MGFKPITTPEELSSAVVEGSTTESLFLDFKRTADKWNLPKGVAGRAELLHAAQREAVRDIIQFANAEGGCVIYGVDEGYDATKKLKVAKAYVPLDDADGLKAWLEDAVKNYAVPTTFSKGITAISGALGPVLAVNVPPSGQLVALWDDASHTIEYPVRTSHGKSWMNPDEAEGHLMNGSRAVRIAVKNALENAATRDVRIPGGMQTRMGHNATAFPYLPSSMICGELGPDWLELRISAGAGESKLNVPYGVIDEAWLDSTRCLNLLLRVNITVVTGGGVYLEPRRGA